MIDEKDDLKEHKVIEMPLVSLMQKNYLDYAVSVIVDRALPDVRDGLKPVHRRILFSMYELKMLPNSAYKKSARMVGEAMGKYHPHGDSSIYNAAVNMAQPWSRLVPLIDGQGNFGSIDGDNPAAMRYCFKAGTRVMTEQGLVKIEKIVSQTQLENSLKSPNTHTSYDLSLNVESSNGFKKASKWIYSGVQDTVKVQTSSGYEAVCTPNEPFLILNEKLDYQWVDASKLKIGDKVCMLGKATNLQIEAKKDISEHAQSHRIHNMSNELAYLLGMCIGSGNLKNTEISFDFTDFDDMLTLFKDKFDDLFEQLPSYTTAGVKVVENNKEKTISSHHFSDNSEFYKFLTNIGLIKNSKINIPEIIFESSLEEVTFFLMGLMRVQFNLTQSETVIKLNDLELCKDLKLLLISYLGVTSSKITNNNDINMNNTNNEFEFVLEKSFSDIRFDDKTSKKLDDILVNIDTKDISKHLSKVKEMEDRGYFYDTIESIQQDEKQAVFDLTVPETHAFTANGFIVHNTEMRLTKAGAAFFEDIDKNTVDFHDNYDGSEREPEVLPVSYPNIWVNGTEGIAVGMATYLPPHNLNETIDLTIALQSNPNMSVEDMLKILPGPDFPTGGIVHSLDGFREAVLTGKGAVKVRAKWHSETNHKGQDLLIIDELPYQVNKKTLIENISELASIKDGDLSDIADIHDESDTEIRIVITLKKGAISAVVFNHLVKRTQMECTYNYNIMLLEGQKPLQMNLLGILTRFLDFRTEIITRKIQFNLKDANARLHLLTGTTKVLSDIEKALNIIRENQDGKSANIALQTAFDIDEIQAQAVLNMRLQKLTGMELNQIIKEFEEVTLYVEDLKDSLQNPIRIQEMVKNDLIAAKERFGIERRTEISYENNDINMSDLIKKEPCLIHVTKDGYLKRMPLSSLEAQNRKGKGRMGIQTAEGDSVEAIYTGSTHDLFIVFTKSGKAMSSRVWTLPDGTMSQRGRHLRNIFETLDEPISNILLVPEIETGLSVITVTAKGKVKRTNLSDYTGTLRKKGVQGVNIEEGDTLVSVMLAKTYDHLLLVASNGKASRFEIDDVVLQSRGRKSVGVRGIRVAQDANVIAAMVIPGNGVSVVEDTSVIDEGKYLLCLGENGVGKRTSVSEFTAHSRGTKGVNCFNINEKTGNIIRATLVTEDEDIIMASATKTMRIHVSDIRISGRNTAGTILMNVGSEKLRDVIQVPKSEDIPDEEISEGEEE